MVGIDFDFRHFLIVVGIGIFHAIRQHRGCKNQGNGVVGIKLQDLAAHDQHFVRLVFILILVHGFGVQVNPQLAVGILGREIVGRFFHDFTAGNGGSNVVVGEFLIRFGLPWALCCRIGALVLVC